MWDPSCIGQAVLEPRFKEKGHTPYFLMAGEEPHLKAPNINWHVRKLSLFLRKVFSNFFFFFPFPSGLIFLFVCLFVCFYSFFFKFIYLFICSEFCHTLE